MNKLGKCRVEQSITSENEYLTIKRKVNITIGFAWVSAFVLLFGSFTFYFIYKKNFFLDFFDRYQLPLGSDIISKYTFININNGNGNRRLEVQIAYPFSFLVYRCPSIYIYTFHMRKKINVHSYLKQFNHHRSMKLCIIKSMIEKKNAIVIFYKCVSTAYFHVTSFPLNDGRM